MFSYIDVGPRVDVKVIVPTSRNFMLLMSTAPGRLSQRNLMIPYLVNQMKRLRPEDDLYEAFVNTAAMIRQTFQTQIPVFISTMEKKLLVREFFKLGG